MIKINNSNNSFHATIGFKSEQEVAQSIDRYFTKDAGSLLKSIPSSLAVKINRTLHFFRTGVWINEHLIGQALNEYRFQNGTTTDMITRIESVFKTSLGKNFLNMAYESATEETTFETLLNSTSFFFQFLKSPTTVGSLLPSSKKLAQEIVAQIPGKQEKGSSRRYIEVGPGTGTFTKELIKKLRKQDQLVLVEYDGKFVDVLRKRFGHLRNVTIIQGDFTQYQSPDKYDYCVSGLPLAAFSQEMVGKIYGVFDKVVKKSGEIAYFEYLVLPNLKKTALRGEEKKNFEGVLDLKERYYNGHNGRSASIWLNVTPARVCRVSV